MKRVTIRECYDGGWSAAYEEAQEKFVIPIAFAVGPTQLEAAKALMAACPDSKTVPGANVAVVRLQKESKS